jgi:integrase/recombinase XerC
MNALSTSGGLAFTIDNSPEARLARLADAYLSGRKPTTRRRYLANLEAFARFLGFTIQTDDGSAADYRTAAAYLGTRSKAQGHELALAFKDWLFEQGLSPSSINNSLTTLRGLADVANTLDLIDWTLSRTALRNVQAQAFRDTRGPGLDGFRAMLAQADGDSPKARRDRAILWLLGLGGALRLFEVAGLDLEHLDLKRPAVNPLRKGKSQRTWFEIAPEAADALAAWLEARGDAPGALFLNFDRAHKGDGRLTKEAIWHMVRKVGREAGLGTVRPHGLRHAAITVALDTTGGDISAVMEFSGHSDMKVVKRYDDNRRARGGKVARMVAAAV